MSHVFAAAMLVAGVGLLSGCSSSMVADHLPTAVGGLPENAPQRPATPVAYPAVHDMPPNRTDVMLSEAEQKRLEAELAAARNRTGGAPETTGTTNKSQAGTGRTP